MYIHNVCQKNQGESIWKSRKTISNIIFTIRIMIKPLQQSKLATAFIDCMGRMQWMVEPACHWFRKCPDGDRQHYIHNDGACVNS